MAHDKRSIGLAARIECSPRANTIHPRRRSSSFVKCAAIIASLLVAGAPASEWPQFLGPTRDAVYSGTNPLQQWPAEGPRKVWDKNIGQGFSGPVISSGKVVLFHRRDGNALVDCFDASSGKPAWSFSYPTDYADQIVGEDHGPRSTPCIADGNVFAFGAEGKLHCLDFSDGKQRWSVDVVKEFGADKGFFGFACSPLVEGGAVMLNIGGKNGAGIVAFHKDTGKLLWKATDHEAGYASPIVKEIGGRRHGLFFTRAGLVGLNPGSGEVHFTFPWRARMHASVNAATPLVIGDRIFLTASYGTGAALLRLVDGKPQKMWSNDTSLSSQYTTPVIRGGFIYGLHGRQDVPPRPALRCVELETGKVRWSKDEFGVGSIILAGDQLLVLLEDGQLASVAAEPDRFHEIGRAQLLGSSVRAHPALAGGKLFARDRQKFVCVELK